jgi:hypothetical protein
VSPVNDEEPIYLKTADLKYWQDMVGARVGLLKLQKYSRAGAEETLTRAFYQTVEATRLYAENPESEKLLEYFSDELVPSEQPCVSQMTIRDLVDLHSFMELSSEYQNLLQSDELETPIHLIKGFEDPVSKPGYLPLMVNLNKPIGEIAQEIKQIQKGMKPGKSRSKSRTRLLKDITREFDKWADYGLLAYFDIKYYADFTNQVVTNNDLGNLIWPVEKFPYIDESEYRIKQYTEDFYSKVFTDRTVATISFG